MQKFKRVLVANRGEIAIRVFRACNELGIRTVAVYTEEDKASLFRTKADEAYQIGKGKGPVEAYLNIEEIIHVAKSKGVDAIHPGYGFLAENSEFSRQCEEAGIAFIGPTHDMIDRLGDKVQSKHVAREAGVPTIPGGDSVIRSEEEAVRFAREAGYPVMIKAAAGGGGRGMRLVESEENLLSSFHSAQNEAGKAFGDDGIFIEKYLEKPKHIEVQILGDNFGNIVHLYERDCSIQRRYQKVVEYAPAICLTDAQREQICADALKIARSVNYRSAGTVEFLMDASGQHYFIEMNPRIQVEHTVTEIVTGIDIVQTQLWLAQGYALDAPEVNLKQEDIRVSGYAIQCRVTTEDPNNHFAPDTGKIEVYRTGSGFGVRLDGGTGFTGAVISPYYDSLLVKVTAFSRSFDDAIRKAIRSLRETRIEGVKTNIGFLINVLNHETFRTGNTDTGFISMHPELFQIEPKDDTELRLLRFIGNKVVNDPSDKKRELNVPVIPQVEVPEDLRGAKQIFDEEGPEGVMEWILDSNRLLMTDTTMRDAHQSLMATRLRTRDMVRIAEATSVLAQNLFSLEMWGGATFDVAYRFLHESPWDRLTQLREKIPNILFQMLIRGANAVGYKNYPDNVIRKFVRQAGKNGIDVFRIFDSLNWMKGIEVALDAVLEENKIAEGCICYTGDILDSRRDKYSLQYYVDKAKQIEKAGAHILGIKDMAALLKPYAAAKLVTALKNEISIPIHLHTHDSTGNGVATLLMATQAGVDIVDAAFSSMAGVTSQPSLNAIVAALENTSRDTGMNVVELEKISQYWEAVRPAYSAFESDLKAASAEIYRYEIPGGQYSNLKPQVESFGLGHRFEDVKEMYKEVNEMVGDIVKVTPSSKFVGDMAIFMVQNGLTSENIFEKGEGMSFPDSAVSYFQGMMGQPEGGFPEDLQKLVLKDEKPITVRPGELLPPEDFEAAREHLKGMMDTEPTEEDIISWAMYPKVFEEYLAFIKENGELTNIGSDIFFHGLDAGETAEIRVKEGVALLVKLLHITELAEDGTRGVLFEVNGNRREVRIFDEASTVSRSFVQKSMADPANPMEVGADIPGNVLKVLVKEGDAVKKGDTLLIVEAMKMEMNVTASADGTVEHLLVQEGQKIEAGELLLALKEN